MVTVANAYNLSPQEVGAREGGVQGQPWLYRGGGRKKEREREKDL